MARMDARCSTRIETGGTSGTAWAGLPTADVRTSGTSGKIRGPIGNDRAILILRELPARVASLATRLWLIEHRHGHRLHSARPPILSIRDASASTLWVRL